MTGIPGDWLPRGARRRLAWWRLVTWPARHPAGAIGVAVAFLAGLVVFATVMWSQPPVPCQPTVYNPAVPAATPGPGCPGGRP